MEVSVRSQPHPDHGSGGSIPSCAPTYRGPATAMVRHPVYSSFPGGIHRDCLTVGSYLRCLAHAQTPRSRTPLLPRHHLAYFDTPFFRLPPPIASCFAKPADRPIDGCQGRRRAQPQGSSMEVYVITAMCVQGSGSFVGLLSTNPTASGVWIFWFSSAGQIAC